MNPFNETWNALRERLTGVFGSFVFVWCIEHPKVVAYALFDASYPNSTVSNADAKVTAISRILSDQSPWLLFWRPLFWTIILLVVTQFLGLAVHWLSDLIRTWKEEITYNRNARTAVARVIEKDPMASLGILHQDMLSGLANISNLLNRSSSNASAAVAQANELVKLTKEGLAPFTPIRTGFISYVKHFWRTGKVFQSERGH